MGTDNRKLILVFVQLAELSLYEAFSILLQSN